VAPDRARPTAVAGLALLLTLGMLLPAGAFGAEDPYRQAREIAGALHCPVCQNLSVADSPADLAVEMRAVIARKLGQGESREAILAYFVDRYGESVLREPPKQGFHLLVWLVPPIGLAAGLALLFGLVRGWRRRRDDRLASASLIPPQQAASQLERIRRELSRDDRLEVDG
jgi:cytochrome c-type biogenesis protein CcmH